MSLSYRERCVLCIYRWGLASEQFLANCSSIQEERGWGEGKGY